MYIAIKTMTKKENDLLLIKINKRKAWIANHDTSSLSQEEIHFEKAVLASVIKNDVWINDTFGSLREGFFLEPKHQKVLSVIVELYCYSQPINISRVSELLKERNEYDSIGGQAFFDELLKYGFVFNNDTIEIRLI